MSRMGGDVTLDDVSVVHSHRRETTATRRSRVLHEMSSVPAAIRRQVADMFAVDLTLFGYGWDDRTLVASCQIPMASDVCC